MEKKTGYFQITKKNHNKNDGKRLFICINKIPHLSWIVH